MLHTRRPLTTQSVTNKARLPCGKRAVGVVTSNNVGILVDVDLGMGRTGVQTPAEALKLAQLADQTPGLRLDGVLCYPGHVGGPANDQVEALGAVSDKLAETLKLWDDHGLPARIVSGGWTQTAFQTQVVAEYTQISTG